MIETFASNNGKFNYRWRAQTLSSEGYFGNARLFACMQSNSSRYQNGRLIAVNVFPKLPSNCLPNELNYEPKLSACYILFGDSMLRAIHLRSVKEPVGVHRRIKRHDYRISAKSQWSIIGRTDCSSPKTRAAA
jgi:hypothetical protein